VTRIPGIPEDHLIVPPFPNPNKHIAIIVRDQVYTFNTRDDKGNLKSKDAFEAALWMIVYDIEHPETEQAPAVGVLTGTDRDSWTKVSKYSCRLHPIILMRCNASVARTSAILIRW
jgi:carnitine O-acetyltransferase